MYSNIMRKKGKLIIFSAPSGSGKSTIIAEVMKDKKLRMEFSISATTRPPRGNEKNGREYYFLTLDQFKQRVQAGDFVEYQEVYPGRFYGTLKSEIERINSQGRNVVLDLDVLGGMNVKKMYGKHAKSIFIKAPSVAVLRERLERRGTDTPEDVEKRIGKAEFELGFVNQFDACIVNDDLPTAIREARGIIDDFINN